MSIHAILKQYWGYTAFRPLQQDIIESVLNGSDTLALLPTGGGKSICFQVPAMAQAGLCLVVSPLVALMKDQVENLKKRGIKAVAIYGTMPPHEIDRTLDNCIYSKEIKFLYVSPERLKSKLFQERLKKMTVNLVAIDEAHCISQWGYDFRPAYLLIAELRDLLPSKVPFLALTATATARVKDDICERLQLKKPHIFVKSFQRPNLSYSVRQTNQKTEKALEILQKIPGCAIIYARSRKRVQEIAETLYKQGIRADYYHAGLDAKTRNLKQNDWVQNKTRVMVCTNAFGMGIDKPDVRLVIHIEPPDSLEAYYQEAGRAGRDEQKAFAVLLYNEEDTDNLHRQQLNYIPPIAEIKRSYQALGNYLKIAAGAGEGQSYDFELAYFSSTFNLNANIALQSLQILQQSGYITLNDAVLIPARLRFLYNNEQIHQLYVTQPRLEPYLKALLQCYGGALYDQYIDINELDLARFISKHFHYSTSEEYVHNALQVMHNRQVVSYVPRNEKPQLNFVLARVNADSLLLDTQLLQFRQQVYEQNVKAVINYMHNTETCRTQTLVAYFGENNATTCGVCDNCLSKNKITTDVDTLEKIQSLLKAVIPSQGILIDDLVKQLLKNTALSRRVNFDEHSIITAIRQLTDNSELIIDEERRVKPVLKT
jgi:ATP-dependent DNA helicase RecQ